VCGIPAATLDAIIAGERVEHVRKSTLLGTVGINTVLAMAERRLAARGWPTPLQWVRDSSDSLQEGRSKF
jgi:hypothetical protein